MPKGFWKSLEKPFVAIAPMANVTDVAFRSILVKYGKPDVMWNEFVSADGLCDKRGREKLLPLLRFDKKEHPIVAQLFSAHPNAIFEASKLVAGLGYDGIDINMGCPDKAVVRQGAGVALIKSPKLAREIIVAAKEGAGKTPVSVKTRIGYLKNEVETWIPVLAEAGLDAITIHGRTMKEMSKVDAHWDAIARSSEIIRMFHSKKDCPIIIGNGDIMNRQEAIKVAKKYHVDGVMIGRGIFFNIFAFRKQEKELTIYNRVSIMLEHLDRFEAMYYHDKELIERKYDHMKKFYKIYIAGFDSAKNLRAELMETKSIDEARQLVRARLIDIK